MKTQSFASLLVLSVIVAGAATACKMSPTDLYQSQDFLDLLKPNQANCDFIPEAFDVASGNLPSNFDWAPYMYFMQKFNEQNSRAVAPVETLFIGDSMMWFCARCSSNFDGNGSVLPENGQSGAFSSSINLGIPGSTTNTTLSQLKEVLGKLRPKNLVISSTGNDFLNGCSQEQTRKNRLEIIKLARLQGVSKIVWMTLPPLHIKTKKGEQIPAVNEDIKELTREGVFVANPFPLLAIPGQNTLDISKYYGDGYTHFNQRGYEDAWLPTIKNCLSNYPSYPLCFTP